MTYTSLKTLQKLTLCPRCFIFNYPGNHEGLILSVALRMFVAKVTEASFTVSSRVSDQETLAGCILLKLE